jgi:nucleoside-diphosphate-sugar epimerase
VGRHLIAALRERGTTVRALARSARAEQAVSAQGAEMVRGDLDDQAAMAAGMTGAEVVYHVAARVEEWGTRDEFHRANVVGTDNVLAAAREAGVPRLVFVSTEAVLVGGPIRNANETQPRPARVPGLYPSSKALAEVHVLAANSPGLQTIVVRPRFIWSTDDTSLLPKLVRAVKQGAWRWIDGGHYLTSTCHVHNLVAGMILAAERGRGGEVYFLTDGPPVDFREFLTALLKTQGVDPGGKTVPRWVAYAMAGAMELGWRLFALSGSPPLTRTAIQLAGEEVTVDDTKARRELGYRNVITVEQGLGAAATPKDLPGQLL